MPNSDPDQQLQVAQARLLELSSKLLPLVKDGSDPRQGPARILFDQLGTLLARISAAQREPVSVDVGDGSTIEISAEDRVRVITRNLFDLQTERDRATIPLLLREATLTIEQLEIRAAPLIHGSLGM